MTGTALGRTITAVGGPQAYSRRVNYLAKVWRSKFEWTPTPRHPGPGPPAPAHQGHRGGPELRGEEFPPGTGQRLQRQEVKRWQDEGMVAVGIPWEQGRGRAAGRPRPSPGEQGHRHHPARGTELLKTPSRRPSIRCE